MLRLAATGMAWSKGKNGENEKDVVDWPDVPLDMIDRHSVPKNLDVVATDDVLFASFIRNNIARCHKCNARGSLGLQVPSTCRAPSSRAVLPRCSITLQKNPTTGVKHFKQCTVSQPLAEIEKKFLITLHRKAILTDEYLQLLREKVHSHKHITWTWSSPSACRAISMSLSGAYAIHFHVSGSVYPIAWVVPENHSRIGCGARPDPPMWSFRGSTGEGNQEKDVILTVLGSSVHHLIPQGHGV